MSLDMFFQHFFNALTLGSLYGLIAIGYTMVYGILRLINFAHGDILMLGAYFVFYGTTTFFLPWGVAVVVAILAASAVGILVDRIAYRPLRRKGAHRLYVVITALMCGLILENGNLALLGATKRKLPEMVDKVVYSIGPLVVTNLKLWVILAAVVVFVLLQTMVTRTKVGMAMRSVSWDRFALPLMGIPLDSVIVTTFVLGSGIAGLGGMLFAMCYPNLEPYMGAMLGWKAFIAAVIGGIGIIPGAMLGGLVLGLAESFTTGYFSGNYEDILAFAILIVILIFRPDGILGKATVQKV